MFARTTILLAALATFTFPPPSPPPPAPLAPGLLSGLVWRNLGPFRGGRISAVSGAIGQPGVFYIGLPLGGLWKTTSAGETWTPILDGLTAVSSVGAVAVAPSDANIVYVGTGDAINFFNDGNGLYKSADAGKTWQHLGLGDTKQIPSILVDPKDPDLVLIAALGDAHKKSETRGVFRSTDGGKTWTKTLYVDDTTGLQRLAWAPDHPEVILAVSQRHYNPPPTVPLVVPPSGSAGAGGRDDPQQLWIDPTNGQRMLMGLDQGAVVTLDGGATWSSWFNQSTDQIYHITVDNSYPYWVYGSQQDAGAIRTRSRGNQGAVTPLDWNPVPGWEWGTTIADPLNPNIVYASGSGIVKISYPSEP